MTPVYRIELDDALMRIKKNNLNLNKPLAEKLAIVSVVCFLALLPLLMIVGWGGYALPLLVIALFSAISSFLLFKVTPPNGDSRYALVVFIEPSQARLIKSENSPREYRLFLNNRMFPISRAIWQSMPQDQEVALFFTEDNERIFYITRAAWVDRSRLELVYGKEKTKTKKPKTSPKTSQATPRQKKNSLKLKGT